MSAEFVLDPEPIAPRENFLNVRYGVRSWLLTRDHKRIALLYLGSVTFFFFLGGLFALLIRLERAPQEVEARTSATMSVPLSTPQAYEAVCGRRRSSRGSAP